ncbi:hypothetical protein RV10_GL001396 [Enterococcus pallens]|nr:hypothetical protein RV10_GL001396 [Enterococcus pallens]
MLGSSQAAAFSAVFYYAKKHTDLEFKFLSKIKDTATL